MELCPADGNDAKHYFNERLEQTLPYGDYEYVKAVILFWEESDKPDAYRKEAESLGSLFQDEFRFDVEYYPIPIEEAHTSVLGFINDHVKTLNIRMKKTGSPCLLIIHYGGHGDPDDDKRQGQERRSVWRAYRSGGPDVKWYRILQNFEDVTFDVLLLFDCCYAAQGGRGVESLPGRIELLAACGVREETIQPGDGSFTAGLVLGMKAILDEKKRVLISDLNRHLSHRKADLWMNPVYVQLRIDQTETSVSLVPYNPATGRESGQTTWRSTVSLLIRTPEVLDPTLMDKMIKWLRGNKPPNLRLQVERVLQDMTDTRKFIQTSLPDTSNALIQVLDEDVSGDIGSILTAMRSLVSEFDAQCDDLLPTKKSSSVVQRLAIEFLEQMNTNNSEVLDIFQKAILMSRECSDPKRTDAASNDSTSVLHQVKDQLNLRRIICQATKEDGDGITLPSRRGQKEGRKILLELKIYDESERGQHLPAIKARVDQVARLMKADKLYKLGCLRLLSHEHDEFKYRFVFKFAVPSRYDGSHHTLYHAIKTFKNIFRPTLDERFIMASRIARAIQHWHNVDWVHQGICPHNIILFDVDEGQQPNSKQRSKHVRLDYQTPYLLGFDNSRPYAEPSLTPYVEDLPFDVYHHPETQELCRDDHTKVHDLYSLGVVLLEIGIWHTAEDMVSEQHKGKDKVEKEIMYKILKWNAHNRLAHYAGTEYQQAVLTCLESDFGVDCDNKRNTKPAEAFQELVLDKLVYRNYPSHKRS